MSNELLPLPDQWSTAVAVVAHPDDLEYGSAAAVARWTAQGKYVAYCLATRGEAGVDGMAPEDAGPAREHEQRAAAAVVGVSDVEFLDHPDGMIEYGLPLRRDIARAIRKHRPELVITANYHPAWVGGAPNQADHVAVGRAVIDAVRDAGNRWVFRELTDQGLEPWNGVQALLVAGSPHAGHAVDVGDHFATGVKSLQAHSVYLAGLGNGPLADPEAFLTRIARATGERFGCAYATAFELITFR
ncbi:PIG-L deacetylase family protein [Nocardia nepalensis]|uniref:PIG-L deacetylase family protein n=1 Tax=Nocardia nepalensis TaxID=3375448 RepID=UPI003B673554